VTKPERAHLYVSASTHSGMRGKNNEDRYAVSTHHFGYKKEIPSVLAVVCDGIGGHRAGEVAAEIAVETISKAVAESDASQPLATLGQAIQMASEAVRLQSETDPERKGMGATCVCAWVIGDRLYTASVGDSRLYLMGNDAIQQVTTDHTWIQEAIEFGALTPEQARGHPNAHVIRRYLGAQSPPEADFRLRLKPDESDEEALANQGSHLGAGDILLLVSDGLTDLVEPHEIHSAVKSFGRKKALQRLIDLANERGGHDNITAVLLEAPASFGQPKVAIADGKPPPTGPDMAKTVGAGQPKIDSRNKLVWTCVVIACLLSIFAAAGTGLYLYLRRPEAASTTTPIPENSSTALPVLPEKAASDTPSPTQTLQSPATDTQEIPPTQSPLVATYTPWPTNTLAPPTPTQTNLPLTATLETPSENEP
jgi:PPM family protein phosphatase